MAQISLKRRLDWYRLRAMQKLLDGRFDPADNFVFTSSPRSGSTLLGAVLNAIPSSCSLFEPLHLTNVPEAESAGFTWRTYRPQSEHWPEGEQFFQRVFSGGLLNDWTSREMALGDVFGAKRQIVKFVRANRLLPWMCSRFSFAGSLLLVRHPCAVVASQLNYGWETVSDVEAPAYLRTSARGMEVLERLSTVEERLAAIWAFDQMPPLAAASRPWKIVTYEELLLRPEQTVTSIADHWDVPIAMQKALSALEKPSSVVSASGVKGIAGWKKQLSGDQIDRILTTIADLGLAFYSRDDEADYDQFEGDRIAASLASVGIEIS